MRNLATASDTVYLTHSKAPSGFSFRLERSEVLLDPGQAQDVKVTVATAKGATGTGDAIINALSRMKDTDAITFKTTVEGTTDSSTSGGPLKTGTSGAVAGNPGEVNGGRSSSKGTPGVGPIVLLVALAAVALVGRRR